MAAPYVTWVARQKSRFNDGTGGSNVLADLDWWYSRCPYCYANNARGIKARHRLDQCPHGGEATRRSTLGGMIFVGGMRAKYGCRNCGLPRGWCENEGIDVQFTPTAQPCEYRTLMYDVVVAFHENPIEHWRTAISEMASGAPMEDAEVEANYIRPTELAEYLGRAGDAKLESCSNIVAVFRCLTYAMKDELRHERDLGSTEWRQQMVEQAIFTATAAGGQAVEQMWKTIDGINQGMHSRPSDWTPSSGISLVK